MYKDIYIHIYIYAEMLVFHIHIYIYVYICIHVYCRWWVQIDLWEVAEPLAHRGQPPAQRH